MTRVSDTPPSSREEERCVGKSRMTKHLEEERKGLMTQARMFSTGDAHRVETRDGELKDVTEERLNIMLGQVLEIDSILNDPDSSKET
jgi:hypothetical protein